MEMGCDDYVESATAFNFRCPNGHTGQVVREEEFAKREQPDAPEHTECTEPMMLVDTTKAW